MRGKARFFIVLLMGVGVLFLFTIFPGHVIASGSDVELGWDKPHYFVGGETNPCHVEYK